jgi:branched-subunit amino acid aminotransferase/4-amino-4-deoxychorismate lyase
MRVTWLDGGFVPHEQATVSIDDPMARFGEGLFETMRARAGVVFRRDQHLARLAASVETLGLGGVPSLTEINHALDAVLTAAGRGDLRVRITVSERPTLLIDAESIAEPASDPALLTAVTLSGAWLADQAIAEHKTLSYAGYRWAQRTADSAGADHALLLDADGRMGEAAYASVVVVTHRMRSVLTAPVRGILPGVGREMFLEMTPATEVRAAERSEWEAASEVLVVNALRGVASIVRIDGRPVGDGKPGPLGRSSASAYRSHVLMDTEGILG